MFAIHAPRLFSDFEEKGCAVYGLVIIIDVRCVAKLTGDFPMRELRGGAVSKKNVGPSWPRAKFAAGNIGQDGAQQKSRLATR